MPIAKTALFGGSKTKPGHPTTVSAKVDFKVDPKTKMMKPMPATQKLICALRKVLAQMSDSKARYWISDNAVQLTSPLTESGPSGKATYQASGRARLGVGHANNETSSVVVEFTISFRDSKDDMGLPDVAVDPETEVNQLPPDTAITLS